MSEVNYDDDEMVKYLRQQMEPAKNALAGIVSQLAVRLRQLDPSLVDVDDEMLLMLILQGVGLDVLERSRVQMPIANAVGEFGSIDSKEDVDRVMSMLETAIKNAQEQASLPLSSMEPQNKTRH